MKSRESRRKWLVICLNLQQTRLQGQAESSLSESQIIRSSYYLKNNQLLSEKERFFIAYVNSAISVYINKLSVNINDFSIHINITSISCNSTLICAFANNMVKYVILSVHANYFDSR